MKTLKLTGVHLLGFAPFFIFIVVLLLIEFPLNEGSVTRAGNEELNFVLSDQFLTNSEGGNPATVSLEVALVLKNVLNFSSHFGMLKCK